jgi:hypothetical protein
MDVKSTFANQTGNMEEELAQEVWDTAKTKTISLPVTPPEPGVSVWAIGVSVQANRATMAQIEVTFGCDTDADQILKTGYRTLFVVEWEGWNTMHFTVASLEQIGEPTGFHQIKHVRLEIMDTTFAGSIFTLGQVRWLNDSPLVRINPYEDLVVNFLDGRFWDRRDWIEEGEATLPSEDYDLEVAWMYAHLRYIQKPGRKHRIAYTRQMNVDLLPYQAVSVFTGTDLRGSFSLILDIDGTKVRAIDRRSGLGGGDEMRAEITGRRLRAITIELEQAEPEIIETIQVSVATSIRWIVLERKGTESSSVAEVRGMAPVPEPTEGEALEAGILPVGILIDRNAFLQLRSAAQQVGPLKKMADEIIAEAEAHLDYEPEQYVGRYLPVDLGNQGCERRVSPSDQMYHFNSCMIYGAVAYALTGDRRYGQIARRALFSTVACDTWQGGFPSRIPSGLPGYRAPFIETGTAEAVALCYDFIFNLLSPVERKLVEDALYEKALAWIDMYLRLKGEGYLLSSNQGAVYTAGLIYAGLVARRSHPDVDAILERAISWFPRMMNNYYKRDGASNEGPGYWEYTTHYVAAALVAISRYKGWDLRDYAPSHISRTMDYLMHLRSLARPHLSFLPLGDNNERFGYNFISISLLFFAKFYKDQNALWLWQKFFSQKPNPPGSLFFGKPSAGSCSSAGLLNLLFFCEGQTTEPALPLAQRFEDCDRVTLRTGCHHGDILFFFEGGPQTFEHCHFDKGQFILEAYGERFAADPGVIRYEDPASLTFKNTAYHNLVTVNGQNQSYKDPDKAVILERVSFGEQFDYIAADLGNSYRELNRCRRYVLFVRPDYFLVLDEIDSSVPGLEWNYHSCVPIEAINLSSGLIKLEGEQASMILAIGSDQPLEAATGTSSEDDTVITYDLRLTPPKESTSLHLAALLVPYPADEERNGNGPEVRVDSTEGGVIFTVRGHWGSDQVACTFDEFRKAGQSVFQVWRNQAQSQDPVFFVGD